MNELQKNNKDSNRSRAIGESTSIIKNNQNMAGQAIYNMGQELKYIKENKTYKELGYSTLAEYGEKELNYKDRMISNLIKIAEVYNSQSIARVSNLGITKLIKLAKFDEEERNDFIENNNVEDMTTRQLKKEIDKKKEEFEEIVGAMMDQEEKYEKDIKDLNSNIEKLVKAGFEKDKRYRNLEKQKPKRLKLQGEVADIEHKLWELEDRGSELSLKAILLSRVEKITSEFSEMKGKLELAIKDVKGKEVKFSDEEKDQLRAKSDFIKDIADNLNSLF